MELVVHSSKKDIGKLPMSFLIILMPVWDKNQTRGQENNTNEESKYCLCGPFCMKDVC